MGTMEYSSNNSGGGWWLKDEDWLMLEARGWRVDWYKDRDQNDSFLKADEDGRWLGALASNASKDLFVSAQEAIDEWEDITRQSVTDLGCHCCGPPHNFIWTDDSGQTHYISPEAPSSGEIYLP